eukprot:s35_g39.t2
MQLVMISQRAEELQTCREEVERLKSEGVDQSALAKRQSQEIRRQKQEIEQLRGEVMCKEAAATRLQEARTGLGLSVFLLVGTSLPV